MNLVNAPSDGFALPLVDSRPELAHQAQMLGVRVLPAVPVDLLHVQLLALLEEVLVDLLQQLRLALVADVERVAAALAEPAPISVIQKPTFLSWAFLITSR